MNGEIIRLCVPEEYNLERIDKFLPYALELDLSRSYLQKLIKNSNILVNGATIKQNYKVKTDDSIEITIPEPAVLELEPQNIPLDILYEDPSVLVLNKQPGLVVHPGPGNWDKTMVNALLYHVKDLSAIGGTTRPGIVHRLDKDTSGLMVVAKNDSAHKSLVGQFSKREVKKKYQAIVVGKYSEEMLRIDAPIGRHKKYRHKMTILESGKEAITEFRIKKIWHTRMGVFSLYDINILTGRTHQIRVHLSSIGNPIVGDPIYSKKWEKYKVPYLLLAATSLTFMHPENGEEMKFQVDIPGHMTDYIERLERNLEKSIVI